MELLEEKLKNAVPDINIALIPTETLIQLVFKGTNAKFELANLAFSFVQIAKSNMFTVEEIAERIKSKQYTKKQKQFGTIAIEVFKKYQEYLTKEGKIDFNDMINTSVELVRRNPQNYLDRYDHILVDDFQDISFQRMELIKCFVNERSTTKLFCVGDDWQSIYQFTGSDVRFFVDFPNHFSDPEFSYLFQNYRSTQTIVNAANSLIANNPHQLKKATYSRRTSPIPILLIELSSRAAPKGKIPAPYVRKLIELLLKEGENANDIMVLSRYNRTLKDIEVHCGAEGVPIREKTGNLKEGARFYSVHKSKGTENRHVILTDLTSGLYGFPCEVQDSRVLEPAKRFPSKSFVEEERRLFYVALTRSKQNLYLFTVENNWSMFLHEIEASFNKIFVDSKAEWDEILPRFVSKAYKGELRSSDRPVFCPKCGRLLRERDGKYGKFLGCSRYPSCDYIYDLKDPNTVSCPLCHRKLVPRTGKYGRFLGCIGYPQCKFAFNLEGSVNFRNQYDILCPRCGEPLVWRDGKFGFFLGCRGYPECNFTFYPYRENTPSAHQPVNQLKVDNISHEKLSDQQVLNTLSNDWKSLPELSNLLELKDEWDIRFLKLKLKELERKGRAVSKTENNETYWILISS